MMVIAHSGLESPSELEVEAPSARDEDRDMVILTPDAYVAPYQELADYRNSTGTSTYVITLTDVYAGTYFPSQGDNNMERIKYFIKDALENWNISYVLLGGDSGQIPVCSARVFTDWTSTFLTDLYYADVYTSMGLFATWDANDDGKYGAYDNDRSALDLKPDVHIGRLPSSNVTQAQWMVDKIIRYEQNAPGAVWAKNITILTGMSSGDTYGDYLTNNFYTSAEGWNHNKLYQDAATVENFTSYENHSVGVLAFWGHGGETSWLGNESFDTNDIRAMTNFGRLPIVTLMACNCGNFGHSSDCFAETFLKMQYGGGICCLAGTQTSNGADHLDRSGAINTYFHEAYGLDRVRKMGHMYTEGVNKYLARESALSDSLDYKNLVEYVFFGDPATNIGGFVQTNVDISCDGVSRTVDPGDWTLYEVSFNDTGLGYADLELELNTSSGQPIPDDWDVDVSGWSLKMDPGDNLTISINVTAPADANASDELSLVLKGTASTLPQPITITLTTTVGQVRSFNFNCPLSIKQVEPDGYANFSFTVHNTGNDHFSFELNHTIDGTNLTGQISTGSIDLDRGETVEVWLNVSPKAGIPSGYYRSRVGCYLEGSPPIYYEYDLNITVLESHGFDASAPVSDMTVLGGSTIDLEIDVFNQGNHLDTIFFNVPNKSSYVGWDFDFKPGKSVDVEAFSSDIINFNISVPQQVEAGSYEIIVNAALQSNSVVIEVPFNITVAPIILLNVTTANPVLNSSAGEQADFEVILANQGNVPLDCNLTLLDVPALWDVTMLSRKSIEPFTQETLSISMILDDPTQGGNVNMTLRAADVDRSLSEDLMLGIYVPVERDLELEAVLETASVLPGLKIPGRIALTNLGNVRDTYDIDATIPSGWILDLSSDHVVLDMEVSEVVYINLTAPSNATMGTVSVPFTARSRTDTAVQMTVTLKPYVGQVCSIFVGDPTRSSLIARPSMVIYSEFAVENLGNGIEKLDLTASTVPEGWSVTVGGATSISYQGSQSYNITIEVPATASLGQDQIVIDVISTIDASVSHQVTIIVTIEESEGQDGGSSGSSNTAFIAAGIIGAVVLALIIVVAIVVVALFVLKGKKGGEDVAHEGTSPMEQDTEATNEQVEQEQATPATGPESPIADTESLPTNQSIPLDTPMEQLETTPTEGLPPDQEGYTDVAETSDIEVNGPPPEMDQGSEVSMDQQEVPSETSEEDLFTI